MARLTVKEFAQKYWPSENALRHYIFKAATNGFEKVLYRINRRILIDEEKFAQWEEEMTQSSSTLCGRKK